MNLHIEKKKGSVKISPINLLVKDLTDMEELEYWEERLNHLGDDYVIAYHVHPKSNKVLYRIYCNTKNPKGSFRC